MIGLLFLLLLLSSSATIDSKCIGTFKELEKEIISNDENLHSLLKAFFPTNQNPGVLVKIQYYINSTDDDGNGTILIHPSALLLSYSNTSYFPDYILYWASSAVFRYFDYRLLQGLSFYLLTFEPHSAYIVIPEFCSNINNYTTIMELINDVTIWMKSYAVDGQISFQGVIEHRLQGYSYSDVISYENDIIQLLYFALIYFLFFSYVLGVYSFAKYHKKVSEMCKQGKQKHQIFRFKSIFWATILTIFLLNVLILALWFGFFVTVSENLSLSSYGIIFTICVMIMSSQYFTVFFAFLSYFHLVCDDKKKCICRDHVVNIFAHVWVFWTVTTTAVNLPVLLFALMLRILINPEQVFVAILLVLTGSLTFGIYITFCIDKLIDINKSDNAELQKLLKVKFCFYLFILAHLAYFGFFLIFAVFVFSIVYVQVISDVDNIGIIDGAGQLFMALLLGLLLWRIKKEYDKFITDEEENNETNNETNNEMTTEVPNTHPCRGMANPTNDGIIDEETPLLH